MRSTLLVTLEYPPQVGGIAEYLANLVGQLPAGSVNVLAPEKEEAHVGDMVADIPVYRRTLLAKRLRPRWLSALYWTDWLFRKEGASVIVVSHLLPMGQVARIMRLVRRVPYIVIVHGMDVALAVSDPRKRRRAKRILNGASLVVANSRMTARFVENAGVPKDRVMILPPSPSFSADMERDDGMIRQIRDTYGMEGSFSFLSVGRLVARKGFDDGIRALAKLKERGHDARYLIVGDGPERDRLKALAEELGVADVVSFAGVVPREELPQYFAAADVFVMVPKSIGADIEGFGTVYLEANVMGRPAVGSRAGGVPDAVADGVSGLLVDPGSPDQLADTLIRLKDDPALRERLASQGKQRVIEEFGWERHGPRFAEAITRIV